MGDSLHGMRSTSKVQKTRLLGSQRGVGGLLQGGPSLTAAECRMGTPSLHVGPLEKPRRAW